MNTLHSTSQYGSKAAKLDEMFASWSMVSNAAETRFLYELDNPIWKRAEKLYADYAAAKKAAKKS